VCSELLLYWTTIKGETNLDLSLEPEDIYFSNQIVQGLSIIPTSQFLFQNELCIPKRQPDKKRLCFGGNVILEVAQLADTKLDSVFGGLVPQNDQLSDILKKIFRSKYWQCAK